VSALHTPGPWETAATDDSLILKGRVKIASTYGVDGDIWGAANARLIAEAPNLLALVIQYRDDLRRPPSPDSVERRLQAVNAAIAKATGQ